MAKARRRNGGRISGAARQGSQQQKNKLMKNGLGAAAVVAVVALIVFAVASSSSSSGEGARAPDFDFQLYQGANDVGFPEGSLSSLHGQPIILNFWAGLCPPCRAEMPQFQAFYNEFQDQIMLLGIDIGPFTGLGSHDDADALLRELGVSYPAGWTDDSSVPRKYGVTGMPTTVFIKSDGEIFRKSVGAIDANFLARATQDLLAAEAVEGS